MLSQLRLTMRPNNQITVGLQNCPKAYPTIYQSLSCQTASYTPTEILRFARVQSVVEQKKREKYDWKGHLMVRRPSPKNGLSYRSSKLDLIQKFQRGLKAFRTAGLTFTLCNLFPRVLSHFSQFRLNEPRTFGNVAGQRIREAGSAMEIAANREMRFCHCTTLTLPANTREAFECLAAYSSYAVNRLFQMLRRRYPDVNYWFFVWEFQKRGALHLHIAHYHPDECEGMLIGNLLIEQWHKILCDISDNSGIWMLSDQHVGDYGIKDFYQYHTQPVRKSVAAYFAKYAGKASKSEENSYVRDHTKTLSPKRYWGSSFQIKDIIKENSYTSLFDVHSETVAMERYQEVLSVLLEYKVLSFQEYSFCKEIEFHQEYGFKGKRDRKKFRKVIAEGFRQTFYFDWKDYQDLFGKLKDFDLWF